MFVCGCCIVAVIWFIVIVFMVCLFMVCWFASLLFVWCEFCLGLGCTGILFCLLIVVLVVGLLVACYVLLRTVCLLFRVSIGGLAVFVMWVVLKFCWFVGLLWQVCCFVVFGVVC